MRFERGQLHGADRDRGDAVGNNSRPRIAVTISADRVGCQLSPIPTHAAPAQNKRGAADRSAAPLNRERISDYFRLVIAVRSADSLTMPVAPHQFDPKPPGLIAVTKFPLTLVVL